MLNAGDVFGGKYRIVRQLGEGGMGTVWEGRHTVIGRRVAIKLLHESLASQPEVQARFRREAQAAAAIGSEHIVDVEDVGFTPDGVPYLVMEYLEGRNLFEILKREGPFEPSRAACYLIQACRALAMAHERGIVHRDLKPENLFLTVREDGAPWIKVIDFGIAKLVASVSTESESRLTAMGTALGTPYYMSPEQIRGAKELDHRADVYSMGVILYELLTGKRPFAGATVNDLIIAIATEEPVPPRKHRPDLDWRLEGVILRAIERDPGDRFLSIAELAAALAPFADRPEKPSAPPVAPRPAGEALPASTATTMAWQSVVGQAALVEPPRLDRRWLPAAVVAGVLVLAGAVGLTVLLAGQDGGGGDVDASTTRAAVTPTDVADAGRPSISSGAAGSGDAGADAGPAAPPSAKVRLQVRADPAAARVRLDGADLGPVPYEGWFDPDDREHRLEVVAGGHEPALRVITFEQDRSIQIGLTRIATKMPASPVPPGGAAAPPAGASQPAKINTNRPRELEPDLNNPYGAP
jgi:serine/threonine-protein kinase